MKKIFLMILIVAGIGGFLVATGKVQLPNQLVNLSGRVAGDKTEQQDAKPGLGDSKPGFQQQVDDIKKNITELTPEDLENQSSIKKILDDLEALKQKAAEGTEMLDVKGNLCEEAKRRFCE